MWHLSPSAQPLFSASSQLKVCRFLKVSKAVEYYSKAELPADEKAAIDELTNGLGALQKAVKDLEKGDVVAAQNNYDAAQNYFAAANILAD
jgi:hypothetical protein